MRLVKCHGCGGDFVEYDGPTHRYMEGSAGCWHAYGEVMARQYLDSNYVQYYRFSVDAYAVQHPGQPSRQSIQSVGVHLIRLYLIFERELPMELANEAIKAAVQIKQRFVWLEPPKAFGTVTVADVARTTTNEELQREVSRWAASAWEAWASHHQTILAWAKELPNLSFQRTAFGSR